MRGDKMGKKFIRGGFSLFFYSFYTKLTYLSSAFDISSDLINTQHVFLYNFVFFFFYFFFTLCTSFETNWSLSKMGLTWRCKIEAHRYLYAWINNTNFKRLHKRSLIHITSVIKHSKIRPKKKSFRIILYILS